MVDIAKFARDFFKLPAPRLKRRWVEEYEGVTVHTLGKRAKRLIEIRRPNEDEETKKYRLANYEPITKGPFTRFLTNLQRVFSAAQVTVDTGNETVQKFIEGANFDGKDLRSYWSRNLTPRMVNDPNGYLVRWVDNVPDVENERVQPKLILVLSKNIMHLNEELLSWRSGEKSMVLAPDPAGGQTWFLQPKGTVYFVVTKNDYFKFIQYGKIDDATYRMDHIYAHELGRFPFDILGGEETTAPNEKTNEDESWMVSFVASAIPYANECARQWSDHQGTLVNSSYPIKEMAPVKCTYTGCMDGYLREKGLDDKTTMTKCPNCKGKGNIPPFGPYGTMLREKSGTLSGGSKVDERPMITYLHPEVDILKYGGEVWRKYKDDLLDELNLLFVKEVQSGVAKEVDREDKVSKLDLLGAHLFLGLMRNTIVDFGELMYAPVDVDTLNITQPPTYTVRTEEELSAEMEKARLGEQPTPNIAELSMEFTRKRFPGDRTFVKITEILYDYDPLYGMSAADVAAGQSGGIFDSVLVRRHNLAFTALRRMVRKSGEAILDADNIFEQLDAAIEELMPQQRVDDELDKDAERNKPDVPPGAGGFGGGNAKKEDKGGKE